MTDPIITGSWIDVVHLNAREGVYWNRMTLAYSDEDWAVLLRHLRRDLGIEILILQNLVSHGLAIYPSRIYTQQWQTRNCADPLGAIMRAASTEGIAMYIGVGASPSGIAEEARELKAVSEEILARYGDEASFTGWYMTTEMYFEQGLLMPDQIARGAALSEVWQALTPDLPRLGSPFFLGGNCYVASEERLVEELKRLGLTVIAYQDGVGCGSGRATPVPPENNRRLYAALRAAHDRAGVTLWANTEAFVFENAIWAQPLLPAPFERLRRQIEEAAPHVDRIVSYTVPGLLTSQTICPDLGAPATESLYQEYRRYLQKLRPSA